MLRIQKTAHDSGDGATILHCPFCGGGQVVGRSDGTVECGFCHQAFTVQVQPLYSGFPQSVDGQPFPIPGMPGQIGGPPAAPGGMDPGMPPGAGMDPGMQDPDAMPFGQDPDADDGGNPFADDAPPPAPPGSHGAPPDGEDGPGDDGGNPFAKKKDGGPGKDGEKPKDKKTSAQDPRYATASGQYLSGEKFTQHLAIRHALDAELEPVLERIRRENLVL